MILIENMQGTSRSVQLRKMVIKLGSAVIAGKGNQMDEQALGAVADSVAHLRGQGVQVILVSSGAIGMGKRMFPEFTPKTIPDRQAMAALGQVSLMHAYKDLFNARGFRVAQILLTRDDMNDRRRYLNARYTLERLLELGVVPVINENDTVTIDELQFGDNDQLSALVATKMNADLLVILSVVDGLYPSDPDRPAGRRAANKKNLDASLIPVVEHWNDEVLDHAGQSRSSLGAGGMMTKLMAVRLAAQAGVHSVIACGKTPGIIGQIVTGHFRGTYFAPQDSRRLSGRDRWIAFGRSAAGRQLVIDAGARNALVVGKKSLLPAGICEVRGEFARGDLVEVIGPDYERVAKGLVNYDSSEVERIKGKKTSQVREILGDLEYEEVIHRDNMAMVD